MTDQPTGSAQAKPNRRQALVKAAFHTIAEKGLEGLRVRDIAAQVGINGATLHHYFPTKETLIQAVVEAVVARLIVTMNDLSGTPAQQLHIHLTQLYHLMRDEPTLFVVLTELNLRARRDPGLQDLIEQEAFWHQRIVGILQAGIEQGQWPPSLDPIMTASAIITLMEGASLWAVSHPERAEQAVRQLEQWLRIA